MKKALLLIAGLALAAACQTIQPVVDEATACLKAGREWAGPGDCREKPKPEPIPEPGPEPSPGPTPQPEPVPAPGPETTMVFQPGEYYQWPERVGPVKALDVSFILTGVDGKVFPGGAGGFLWALKGTAESGAEYSIQLHIFRDGQSDEIRIITQNFTKGCDGARHCDVNDVYKNMGLVPGERYPVHIYGPVEHTSRGFRVWRMDMIVRGETKIFEVPWYGDFASIEYIRVGNGEIFPHFPGQNAPLTIINPRWR
ncbi:MAG: hypothetical protein OEV92_03975 [Nitrospinota bacterium]|nr:hypothetical protein [Nitrospinota bacterium]